MSDTRDPAAAADKQMLALVAATNTPSPEEQRLVALTARLARLEQLLLTALTALDNHFMHSHGFQNEDVSGAVELLREAMKDG